MKQERGDCLTGLSWRGKSGIFALRFSQAASACKLSFGPQRSMPAEKCKSWSWNVRGGEKWKCVGEAEERD